MTVPLLDLSQQHQSLLPELREAFEAMIVSGRFILGPHVEGFERKLADYCHARHAIGMSSGTDAILAALMALNIGPGDEVVTTPFTFFATAGCIARTGARPVFIDIEPTTFNLDPTLLAGALNARTKAIIPIHLFGQTADMGTIMRIARRAGVPVIEDAAQAIGARDGNDVAGAIGDMGCLSFYPSKNLSALGDAGACVTNNPEYNERLRIMRTHGEVSRYHHSYIGGNFRIDAIQASILSIKLPHLEKWTLARRANAKRYHELLEQDLPLVLPVEMPGRYHVYNQYTVRVPGGRRDELRRHLAAHGIGHEVYYPVPLHLQKCFEHLGHQVGDFPQSERAAQEVLSLPIFPELQRSQQDEVIRVIREFYR
ncbi:MAG: DegT/DnrJ/EryC1/StrS family aminotransferase [Planctomycetota bacterium]|nr:DegT/DnrJ/EryC1/StrS family aminotransferase [Planctomycetota bacterium]